MKYYVGQDAESTADTLWAAYERAESGNGAAVGNIRGNIGPEAHTAGFPRNDASP
jgi:hypothetical protein